MLGRTWRKGKPRALLVESKLVQPLQETVRRSLRKLKIKLPKGPAIPLLNIYPEETKSLYRRGICTPMFIAAIFTSQNMETTRVSVNR